MLMQLYLPAHPGRAFEYNTPYFIGSKNKSWIEDASFINAGMILNAMLCHQSKKPSTKIQFVLSVQVSKM